jgi:F-box and leucine-rich repeat protein 2/20
MGYPERSIFDVVATPTSSSKNLKTIPNLLHLSDDLLIFFLSSWLDVRSLGLLDIAVANRNNRLLWQKCLSATNASVFDDWRYNHSSISWLIQRRISATKIQINYRNGMKVSDATFDGIHIPLLRSIYLSNCTGMTDRGVLTIVKGCSHLQLIDLTRCISVTDRAVAALSQRCPKLQSINLTRCPLITDVSLRNIAKGCVQLVSINLECCNITDHGIAALVQRCRLLKSVNLMNCENITDLCLDSLAKGVNLTSLNLEHCNITDIGLLALALGCYSLQFLNLSHCRNITDYGMDVIANGCTALESVVLSNCEQISDASLISLSRMCPKLKSINMQSCINVSDAGVICLAKGCVELQVVDFSDCDITDLGLCSLVRR